MGRVKIKKDILRESGGLEVVINKCYALNFPNVNTQWKSEIWSNLSRSIFLKNEQSLRRWLYTLWHENRWQVKSSVNQLCAGCAVVMDDDVHGFAKDQMETQSEPVDMGETVANNMVIKKRKLMAMSKEESVDNKNENKNVEMEPIEEAVFQENEVESVVVSKDKAIVKDNHEFAEDITKDSGKIFH